MVVSDVQMDVMDGNELSVSLSVLPNLDYRPEGGGTLHTRGKHDTRGFDWGFTPKSTSLMPQWHFPIFGFERHGQVQNHSNWRMLSACSHWQGQVARDYGTGTIVILNFAERMATSCRTSSRFFVHEAWVNACNARQGRRLFFSTSALAHALNAATRDLTALSGSKTCMNCLVFKSV